MAVRRPAVEVADVLRQFGEAYRSSHRLSAEQRQAMWDIEQCRTAALGGHVDACDSCGALRISYNSCGNRHCPKCGALKKLAWLEKRRADLLPIPYFHVVFTTDHALNDLAQVNPRAVYDLVFKAASEALQEAGRRYLGGEVGITAILHTWGQTMQPHIHLHCIVTGGALSADGQRWQGSAPGFLCPIEPLTASFRERMCQGLEKLYRAGRLQFTERCVALAEASAFAGWLAEMRSKDWQSYIKPPFGGPDAVYDYIGRYVHRIAIANQRIVRIGDRAVTFTYRDNKDGGRRKEMALCGVEFIRRFLWHVLPKGYQRIRHYGLLHGSTRQQKLQQCRMLLGVACVTKAVEKDRSELLAEIGIDLLCCPCCGKGRLVRVRTFDRDDADVALAELFASYARST